MDELLSLVSRLFGGRSTRGQRGKQLARTLQTAKKHIEKGKGTAAKPLLEPFIGQIELLIKRGELTAAEGRPLIDTVRAIMSALEDNNPKTISGTEQLNREIRNGLA